MGEGRRCKVKLIIEPSGGPARQPIGRIAATVLSILRQAAEPMTSRDIALEMLVTRALDKDDQKLLALMTKRVGVTLRLERLNAVVRSSSGPGQYMIWEIAR